MKSKKKIGLIGTINRDIIKFQNGTVKKGWGGALYNLKSFSQIFSGRVEIYPVCNIGADCYRPIMQILNKLPGVKSDYINKVSEKNNACYLTYLDNENKTEILKGGVPRLTNDNAKPLLNCEVVLVNYLSGSDIYLRSLLKFRKEYSGKIYIDLHSLTLGKRNDGMRYLRCPANWEKVVSAGDYIQMNRQELNILTTGNLGPGERDIDRNISVIFRHLKQHKVDISGKIFIITDGASGSILYYLKRDRTNRIFIPVAKRQINCDTTGCGDSYSAGFIYGLITGKNLKNCGQEGNRWALNCILSNLQRQI
jgi:sugar/nucleoside kinase (ribokinase family)